ncbi:MAG: RNA polymerase sigma factor, partial [Odoribacter splanchnicus]
REEWVAADLVQEAFVKLWENRQNFSSLLTIRSYLYTIVRNSGINYLRYMKMKAEKLYIADLIVKAIAGSLSGEEVVELRLWRESSEENERLYQELLTMGGMELQQKEVVYLCRRLPGKCCRKKYRENGNTGPDRIY